MNSAELTAMVVGAALRAGGTQEWRGIAVNALHDALRRSLGGDAVGTTAAMWQERWQARLSDLPEADLEELRHFGYAVLTLADPAGMASGRYGVVGVADTPRDLREAPVAAPTPPPTRLDATMPSDRRPPDARVRQAEQAVSLNAGLLGADHPATHTARRDLGIAYALAGRAGEAVNLLRAVISDLERLVGPDHPDTQAARTHLVLAESAGRSGGEGRTGHR